VESICQADLEALLDREAIRDCLFRYCRGIDRADEAILRSTYWPDATDCHGAYRGSADGFIAQAIPRLLRGGRGVHQVSNILIELHGAVAAAESSFLALQNGCSAAAARDVPRRPVCGPFREARRRMARRRAHRRLRLDRGTHATGALARRCLAVRRATADRHARRGGSYLRAAGAGARRTPK
jgi:hypothetical protein